MKTMKHFFKLTVIAAVATATIITVSAFTSEKKENNSAIDSYQICCISKSPAGANWQWTWMLTNPNPGNGSNGTLQNVSHWSFPLSAFAESALVSAEYSLDGVTWISVPIEVERDPSIRQCTTVDVLKFNMGTSGSQPTYYRATFNYDFSTNPFATSWIKTGGGMQGCNMYFFPGIGSVTTN
jgi:hypothetical protein